MTSRSSVALADAPSAASTRPDWLLTLTLSGRPQLTSADAPIAERDSVQAAVLGLLFDRDRLSADLDLPEDTPECELVLSAYERWGEAALALLRGCFVVAIADQREGRTLVARDPLGLHPLFYAALGNRVVCAGSPHTLFARGGVPRSLNRAALADHLCYRWPEPQETFYEGVRRVLGGARLLVRGGHASAAKYWTPVPDDRPMDWLDEADLDQFSDLLDQAVDRCLSTGPTGIFLSGGLDSISVAAVAADRARQLACPEPLALSLGFPHPECDERPVQTAVAQQLGLRHHLIDFRDAVAPRGLFALALEMNAGASSPVNSSWSPAYQALARRGRTDGVETILTGSGGDEWLTVSAYFAADLIRAGDVAGYRNFVSAWWRSYRASPLVLMRSVVWKYGLRPLAGQALSRLAPGAWERSRQTRAVRRDPLYVAPDSELKHELKRRTSGSLVCADPPNGFYLRDIRAGLDHPVLAMELEERHDFGRRAGVRFLHPYWDADLVDMLIRTPPALLDRGGRSKGLVRPALAQRFPDLGFDRQRKAAATPFYQEMLAAEGAALVDNLGGFPALGDLGVIDAPAARVFAGETIARNPAQLHRVWDLLNLETWVRCS
ncbi:MAG TPA: asparagine synthase-related protein [Vicinamibacterales bacterium]